MVRSHSVELVMVIIEIIYSRSMAYNKHLRMLACSCSVKLGFDVFF